MSESEVSGLLGFSFPSCSTYTILEEIGHGGMGVVFLAQRESGGVMDHVALKTIRIVSDQYLERLREEANTATGLRHENIVRAYGLETVPYSQLPDEVRQEIGAPPKPVETIKRVRSRLRPILGRTPARIHRRRVQAQCAPAPQDDKKLLFLVVEYVDGTDLRTLHFEHMKKRLLIPWQIGAFIISRICRALGYAHDYIVHRDVTPENILINSEGVAKLSDFGVAVPATTETRELVGKLSYMSPEQLQAGQVDERTDVFSLGLVAYEILTGLQLLKLQPNLPREQQIQTLLSILWDKYPAVSELRPDVPKILSDIVAKMLTNSLEARFQKSQQVADVLEQKCLYASGFGPTNQSLKGYIEMFDNDFKTYTEKQIRPLAFMKGDDGKIVLQRRIRPSEYGESGLKYIWQQPPAILHEALGTIK
jgi:serine/threonine protein kinase